MPEPDYKLTIIPRPDGGYEGRIESSNGDLWAGIVRQDPQEGDQFRDSLISFAKRFGITWEVKVLPPAP